MTEQWYETAYRDLSRDKRGLTTNQIIGEILAKERERLKQKTRQLIIQSDDGPFVSAEAMMEVFNSML